MLSISPHFTCEHQRQTQVRRLLVLIRSNNLAVLWMREGTVIDYRNWGIGLGRRFRSLKLWFVLRSFGVEGFQNYVRKVHAIMYLLPYLQLKILRCYLNQSIQLNDHFASLIRAQPDLFELVTTPSFGLSVFRIVPNPDHFATSLKLSTEDLNVLNRLFFQKIFARADLMLTQTELNGVHCIRYEQIFWTVGVPR
jgi:aromatic-L-amino-acid/L-tryptophan decarboxylase